MQRGGFRIGAGRPGRNLKIEDCRRLDVREMQKAGLFRKPWSGSWFWKNACTGETTSAVGVVTTDNQLQLSYVSQKKVYEVTICLSAIRCGFGYRKIFKCPACQMHCSILLLLNCHFRCRRCQDVPYRCQAEDPIGRGWLSQFRLEERLTNGLKRPRRMHAKTYAAIRAKIIQVQMQRDEMLDATISKWA